MKPRTARLVLGTGTIAAGVMFGFLVGASETPLAGTVVSSVFVAAISLISALFAHKDAPAERGTGPLEGGGSIIEKDNLSPGRSVEALFLLGLVLGLFCVAFLGGVFWGAHLRTVAFTPQLVVPWPDDNAPKTPEEAWYWMTFSRSAKDMGLPDDEIRNLYKNRPPFKMQDHVKAAASAASTTGPTEPALTPTDGMSPWDNRPSNHVPHGPVISPQ